MGSLLCLLGFGEDENDEPEEAEVLVETVAGVLLAMELERLEYNSHPPPVYPPRTQNLWARFVIDESELTWKVSV